MDNIPIQSILGTLTQNEIVTIYEQQVQLCSEFRTNYQKNMDQKDSRIIQVRGQFVVEVDENKSTIISGFQCQYEINFEIIRASLQESRKIGRAVGIRFIFKNQNDRAVQLFSEDSNILQDFGRILSQKFIVQLGFHKLYENAKILGKGAFAAVYCADDLLNKRSVAVKAFKRSVFYSSDPINKSLAFKKQFKTLLKLDHVNACKCYGVFETGNSTYTILEYLPITLMDWLMKVKTPNTRMVKSIMKQLLQGVQYIHSIGIMHRDLKLQNIMLKRRSVINPEIVIVDFGLAEQMANKNFIYRRCGTPGFVAPQIININPKGEQLYGQKCDIFSLGVIFFALVYRKLLFSGLDQREIIKLNKQCEISDNEYMKNLSDEAKDLMMSMLEKDPKKRLSATDALKHQFFTKQSCPLKKVEDIPMFEQATTVEMLLQ